MRQFITIALFLFLPFAARAAAADLAQESAQHGDIDVCGVAGRGRTERQRQRDRQDSRARAKWFGR